MALAIRLHYFDPNENVLYRGVTDFSYDHTTGVLTLSPWASGSNLVPSSGMSVDLRAVLRLEIEPEETMFPGNTAGTPSG